MENEAEQHHQKYVGKYGIRYEYISGTAPSVMPLAPPPSDSAF